MREEIKEYKEILESKIKDYNKVVDKLNIVLKVMIKGVINIFFVLIIFVFVMFVIGLIGYFFGIEYLYSFINGFIDDYESVW